MWSLSVPVAITLVGTAFCFPGNGHTRQRDALRPEIGRRLALQVANATCKPPTDIPTVAPKKNPFYPLTDNELKSVLDWLNNPAHRLNLTDPSIRNVSLSDNYISHVEILKPNKTDVLAYLDGKATAVPRYARIVITEGAAAVPAVAEYYLGPLPISETTALKPLNYMYNGKHGNKVLINGGYLDAVRSRAVDVVVTKTMSSIADITQDLCGFQYHGAGDSRTSSTYYVQNPYSTDGTTGIIWTPWRRAGLAPYDQISDLYVSFDIAGTDPNAFRFRKILYNKVLYNTTDEFRAAWAAGKITKSPAPPTNITFLQKNRFGPLRDLENRLAPTVLTLDGKRYKVDNDNKYVEYLGWSFYTRFDNDVGIQFYDIKFKGERIMYEMALQDAVAQYFGHNPFQAGTAYMDRFYGIGGEATRLIPGFDCPYHSTYWNAEYTQGSQNVVANNTICIFEMDMGTPVTRHFDPAYYFQATKGSKLVVRMIATVGNYDYLFDYAFWVDGTVTIDVHASGYLQGNYYRPDEEGKWGARIGETISGALHTHVVNFKADFDLIDTANTFQRTDVVVENVTMPWFEERGTFELARYNISEMQTEDEGLLSLPQNGQSMYTIINKARLNRWGEPRGYRIVPQVSNVVLPTKRSPFFLKSAQFAKQPFAISRQHDTEPASSASLNQNVPEAPLVEFYKFFNGENLVQQDLVAWVNLGMHHFPRAEDIPNTIMSEAHSSIMFAPHNWGDTELTVDLSNAIMYKKNVTNADGVSTPNTNGVNAPSCLGHVETDELLGVY